MGECSSKEKEVAPEGTEAGLKRPLNPDAENPNPHELKWGDIRTAWDTMDHLPDEEKVYFDHLAIAKDGGMSEIGQKDELWYSTRYISSSVLLLFVGYNIWFIFNLDMTTLNETKTDEKPMFLLTPWILSPLLDLFGIGLGKGPQLLVPVVEMVILAGMILYTLLLIISGILAKHPADKWRAVVVVCWEQFPELSAFSSLKMLQYIVPQQLSYDLNYIMFYEPGKVNILKFLVTRPMLLMVGLDCFIIKFRAVAPLIAPLHDAEVVHLKNVLAAVMFMNQILGVVQIAKTIKWRLYRFIFGGEDGVMSDTETVRQNVWEAMVAKEIFESYKFPKSLAMMLTFCDDDFQMLLLNEANHDKGHVHHG